MNILYAGQLGEHGSCSARASALERLGHKVHRLDWSSQYHLGGGLLAKVSMRLLIGRRLGLLNSGLLEFARALPAVDLIWVDKAVWIQAETVRELTKIAPVVHYTPDPALSFHKSRHFRASIGEYSLVVTTKSYEMDQYRALGARRLLLVPPSYDPSVHRYVAAYHLRKAKPPGVVLVGHYEAHYHSIAAEIARKGVPVSVFGPLWEGAVETGNLSIARRPAVGEEYVKVISESAIGLGVLSKLAPDQTTTRSVEIPACGTLLLAERTRDHEEMFVDGVEAVFFSSAREAADLAIELLADEHRRDRLARAGLNRCLASGYSHDAVLARVLTTIS